MLARFVLGAVAAGAVIAPALAGQMNADEARKFVAGKVFDVAPEILAGKIRGRVVVKIQ